MKYTLILALAIVTMFSCAPKQAEVIHDGTFISVIQDSVAMDMDNVLYKLSAEEGDQIFYLIRHAEKDTVPVGNPKLTETGLARANYLSELLKGTRVDAIYSTLYTRTLFTVDTLAARKGLKIQPYEPSGLKDLYESISDQPSLKSVVIVGHSNTTPALANVILGKQEFESGFAESDYDNILVVIRKANGDNLVHKLKYKPELVVK